MAGSGHHRHRLRGVHRLLALLGAGLVSAVRRRAAGGRLPSPFFSPLIFEDALPVWISPAIFILWILSASGRPATTTERPTTAPTSPIRPPARSVSRLSTATRWNGPSPSSCRTSTAGSCTAGLHPALLPFLRRADLVLEHRPGADRSGQLHPAGNAALLAGYSLSYHSLRRLAAGSSNCSRVAWQTACATEPLSGSDGDERAPHAVGWVSRCPSRWPTCTCGRSRPAGSWTRRSTCEPGGQPRGVLPRRPGDRGWRRRASRGDRSCRGRRVGRAHLQVAAGEGPHRHGRGWRGRGAGQRGGARLVADPLPRHHGRRQDAQPLAHGAAPCPGAPERVRELERWGAVFDRTRDGRILQRPFGGHTHPRGRTSATAPGWR